MGRGFVNNQVCDYVQQKWIRGVCVCMREEERESTQARQKNKKPIFHKNDNRHFTRKGDGGYIVTFSLHSLTKTTSPEIGGNLTTS